MVRNLGYAAKTQRVSNAVAAGTSNINCSAVDLFSNGGPYEGARFTVLLNATTTGQQTIPKVQGSNTNNGSDWTDLAGTHVGPPADPASNGMLQIDLYRPQMRYLQLVIQRSVQNAAVDGAICDLYLAHNEPVPADTSLSLPVNVQPYVAPGTA